MFFETIDIDDSHIVQETDEVLDTRFYFDDRTPDMRYLSVTKLKDKFNTKGIEAIREWNRKNIEKYGAEEAERMRREASASGTRIHDAIEHSDTTKLSKKEIVRYNNLMRLVQKIDFPSQEKKILWINPDDRKMGYGGKFDMVGVVDKTQLLDAEDVPIGTDSSYHMIDWKNVGTFYSIDFYVGYYLQCAAYIAGLNQKTNCKYRICEGLLGFTTAKTLKLVHLDKRCIKWYWQNFREIVRCHTYNEEFDYEAFKNRSIGYLTEDGSIEDYLPKQVYLSNT